jgi:hypothetical protein
MKIKLNPIPIPALVDCQLRREELRSRHLQIQDDCNRILESDSLFERSYRQLRDAYTSGLVAGHIFRNTFRWQVRDCLRRAGLPLSVAKTYEALTTWAL